MARETVTTGSILVRVKGQCLKLYIKISVQHCERQEEGKKIPICMNFEWQANRDATKGRLGGAKECLGNSSFPPCPIACIILAPVLLATLDKLRDEENDSSQYQLNLAQPDTQRSSVTSNSRCLASTCGIGFVPACPMPYLNFEEYPFTF